MIQLDCVLWRLVFIHTPTVAMSLNFCGHAGHAGYGCLESCWQGSKRLDAQSSAYKHLHALSVFVADDVTWAQKPEVDFVTPPKLAHNIAGHEVLPVYFSDV